MAFDNPRYKSGTELSPSRKEENLDALNRMLLHNMTDELYLALKKLSIEQINELHKLIAARIMSETSTENNHGCYGCC